MNKNYICLLALFTFFVDAMEGEEKKKMSPDIYKSVTIGVTIYRDPKYDQEVWRSMVEQIQRFEQQKFSMAALHSLIHNLDVESTPAKGIWGSVPITYMKDSEKIDGPKKSSDK